MAFRSVRYARLRKGGSISKALNAHAYDRNEASSLGEDFTSNNAMRPDFHVEIILRAEAQLAA